MDTLHTYFRAKAIDLPKKLITCYFSRYCHAGVHNVRLLTEEMIPQEVLRHPNYASLTVDSDLPAVNTSFNQPTKGFDAIPIDFCDPANQPYVLRFYLRGFLSRYKSEQGIYKVKEDWPNQTVEIQAFSSRVPFRLLLELRRDDPARIFLTLYGPKNVDYKFDFEILECNIPHYDIPSRKWPDLNSAFQKQYLNYEILNSIIQLVKAEPVCPERNDALHLRLDLGPICDLINLPIPTNERLKHIKEMKAKTVALEDYQVQRSAHYELVCDDGLFFTQGLKFCKEAIRLAIDLLIENGNQLLTEYHDSMDCAAIKEGLVEDLFELTRQVGEQLAELDPKGLLWHAVCTKQDSSLNENRVQSEQVVLLRNALVELERCWKELELHPAFERKERISDTALREVGHKWDSDKLCLKRIVRKAKKSKPTCHFQYEGDLDEVINEIFPTLIENDLIAPETKPHKLKLLFMGREDSVVIKWNKEKLHILTHLFKELCDGEEPLVVTRPNSRYKWTILKRHFVDFEGKQLPENIRSESKRTKDGTKALIERIVEAFRMNRNRDPK